MPEQTATMAPTVAEESAEPQPSAPSEPDPAAAQRMTDAFVSVGTVAFDRFYMTLHREAKDYYRAVPAKDLKKRLPENLAWAAKHRLNLIIRPRPQEPILVQLDDISPDAADRLRPVAFLGLETSPGNHQAWIALTAEEADKHLVRRLKKGTDADAGATGAVRIAGSINFKEKYAPDFPRVQIVHSAPGLVPSRAQLESLGVVAASEAAAAPGEEDLAAVVIRARPARRQPRGWPDYQRCLDGAPPNGEGTGPDRSSADFFWCLLAVQWGWGIEETVERLMELSDKAQENGEGYALRTAERAAEAVERNGRRAD